MHDHYHNLDFTLNLANGQNLVKAITGVSVDTNDGVADMTAQIANDKQGIDVHIERACRQTDIDIAIDVDLNTEEFTKEPVFDATTVTDGHGDGTSGGLHTGIFDEQTVHDLRIILPAAEINRAQSTITFDADENGHQPKELKAFPGSRVTLPTGDEYAQSGDTFGGWNDAENDEHYAPGTVILMPESDRTFTPAFGRIGLDIEIEYEKGEPIKTGNQMAEDYIKENHPQSLEFYDEHPFNFINVSTDDEHKLTKDSVKTITFKDQMVEYDTIENSDDESSPYDEVKVTNVPNVVYARHIGATDNDKVVVYLTPRDGDPGYYDAVVAAPGGVKAPSDCTYLFGTHPSRYEYQNYKLESVDLTGLDTSDVTNMSGMFARCTGLTNIKFGGLFNTSRVTDMSGMFDMGYSASSDDKWEPSKLTSLELSGFDVSSVTDMVSMFAGCTGLTSLDLSGFNTHNDEAEEDFSVDMGYMFSDCSGLTNITFGENFDTSHVTNMSGMFSDCFSLTSLDLSSFDTSRVRNMGHMFEMGYDSNSKLTNITFGDKFVTNEVTNMRSMFSGCSSLKSLDLSGFNTSNVGSDVTGGMDSMFSGCSSLTSLDLSKFDTKHITNMSEMFDGCSGLTNLDVSNFNTIKVTNMEKMFSNCSSLKSLDLSGFNTSNVGEGGYGNMRSMFSGCSGLTSLTFGKNFDTRHVMDMSNMFSGCSSLNSLDLSGFNTGSVGIGEAASYGMESMFSGCSSLTSLDLSKFDTSHVQDMSSMFFGCSALERLDVSSFDTSKVMTMSSMFSNCSELTELTLGDGFSLESVETVSGMFNGCDKLATIEGAFHFGAENGIDSLAYMFSGCSALTSVTFIGPEKGVANFDDLTTLENMFNGCSSLTDVTFENLKVQNLTHTSNMFNGCTSLENITLDLQDIRAQAGGFNAKDMFTGVPTSAHLDISGIDNAEIQTLIRDAFPGDNVTTDAPDEPSEEPPVEEPDEPEQPGDEPPAEEPGDDTTTDEPTDGEQPGSGDETEPPVEEPGNGDENEPPVDEPQPPVEPEQPTDEPQEPAQPEEPAAPEQPAEPEAPSEDKPEALSIDPLSSLIIHPTEVNEGDTITYKITLKYKGDKGVKSGRINLRFPIPEGIIEFVGNDKLEAGWHIETTEIRETEGAGNGYLGGRVVEKPTISDDGKTIEGVFEGLYTGNEVVVSLIGTVDSKPGYDEHDYTFWDATAYAHDSAGSATSDTIRLWHSKDESETPEPPEDNTVILNYAYTGDVPNVALPDKQLGESGSEVTVAEAPNAEGYTFDGWTRSDGGKVNPGSTLTLPDNDLTLTGHWTQDESAKEYIDVTYSNTKDMLETDTYHVEVGVQHPVQTIVDDVDHQAFDGWEPKLTIGGEEISLEKDDEGNYIGKDSDGTTYAIGTDTLLTEQFAGKNKVKVEYVGQWHPYTGTIHFDANTGRGEMDDMTNVAWDSKDKLPENTFTPPTEDYEFAGWALSTEPDAKIVETTEGLITEDDKTVTLYAKWKLKHGQYGVVYELDHVTSSNDAKEVGHGGTYTTTLKADDGYTMKSVDITMAGKSITSDCYDKETGDVKIKDVAGDIIIKAAAEAIDDGGDGGDGGDNGNGGDNSGGGITPPDKPDEPDEPDNGIADPDDTGVADLLNTDDHIAYMHGYEDDTFGPARTITRGEVASAFYRLLRDQDVEETKEFPDVPKDSWYHDTIAALAGKGLISGYEDGTFQPDKAITRAEFAAMATRFAKASTDKDVDFVDVAKDSWYYGAVQTAVSYGWLRGYEDDTFRPEQNISRAEAVSVINRMLARIADQSAIDDGAGERYPDVSEKHWAFYEITEASSAHDYTRPSDTAEEEWDV